MIERAMSFYARPGVTSKDRPGTPDMHPRPAKHVRKCSQVPRSTMSGCRALIGNKEGTVRAAADARARARDR